MDSATPSLARGPVAKFECSIAVHGAHLQRDSTIPTWSNIPSVSPPPSFKGIEPTECSESSRLFPRAPRYQSLALLPYAPSCALTYARRRHNIFLQLKLASQVAVKIPRSSNPPFCTRLLYEDVYGQCVADLVRHKYSPPIASCRIKRGAPCGC
jgi:hypothetical protein